MPGQLETGTVVIIRGLKAKPELNGKVATVESLNEENGRYNVKLEAGEVLALKPEALELPAPKNEDERTVSVKACAQDWFPDSPESVTLKLTLSGKQLKKELKQAVLAPFLKAFTKRVAPGDEGKVAYAVSKDKAFTVEDVASIRVDGVTIGDLSIAANVVLLPRKTVELVVTLCKPPPPPPLLNKNVALTRLDDNAYKNVYNGLWASVIGYDAIRGRYQCAASGDTSQLIWVYPDQCIELIEKKVEIAAEDFDDFDGVIKQEDERRKRAPPPIGTTAHEIYLRQLPRWAAEDESNRKSKLQRMAFSSVPLGEKFVHINTQIEYFRGRLAVQRTVLMGDVQLDKGNTIIDGCAKDTKKAKEGLKGLYPRIKAAQKEAEQLAASCAAAKAAEESADSGTGDSKAAVEVVASAVDVSDAANAPAAEPPKALIASEHESKLVELRYELDAAIAMAEEHEDQDKAVLWHCKNRKQTPEHYRSDSQAFSSAQYNNHKHAPGSL